MQQTGCLKKRRRRNLTKVAGLTVSPYDEASDTYRGSNLFDSEESHNGYNILSNQKIDSASITMSRIHEARRNGNITSSTRITRDPTFLMDDDSESDDETKSKSELSRNPTFPQDTLKNGVIAKTNEVLSRPNLLDKTVMRRLYQLVTLGLCSCSFPWYWNKKKAYIEKFDSWHEKIWNIVWFIISMQMVFVFGFQIYSFYNRVSTSDGLTYREIFMGSFSLYWYGLQTSFNWNMYLYKESIRTYINTMLAMNKKLCDKYLVDIEDYKDGGRILINVSIPSNCSQILASVALFLVMPYQPWYLYSYIYTKDNPWWWLIPGAIQELIMTGQVITSYCIIPWIVVAHTNSVDFWVKEIHNNNDTGYTLPEIRDPNRAIEIYRSLQILCACFNECMAPVAIPIFKTATFVGIIPCGYVLIRSMNHLFVDEFPGILTYPIGVIDLATAGIAMLSMAAEMHDLGIGFVDSWSRTRQKDFRRILMSLPTLKVKVGHAYHITVSTIITFFRTCTDYIIDCIMTFP